LACVGELRSPRKTEDIGAIINGDKSDIVVIGDEGFSVIKFGITLHIKAKYENVSLSDTVISPYGSKGISPAIDPDQYRSALFPGRARSPNVQRQTCFRF